MRFLLSAFLALAIGAVPAFADAARPPLSMEAHGKQLQELRTRKDFTRKELVKLLDTTIDGPYLCPTGELWPAFEHGAPHTAATVRRLIDLFKGEKKRWKRYHLATALSHESEATLRHFWLKLLAERRLPEVFRFPIVTGLARTGTDQDVASLASKLGTDPTWDAPLLQLLYDRPISSARPAVLARFRDRTLLAYLRANALTVLVRMGGPDAAVCLREAAGDEDELVRKRAEELSRPQVAAGPTC